MASISSVDWDTIKGFIQALGWVKGVFAIFFFLMHSLYFSAMRGRLKDRQSEIDRIASENREYRARFMALIDKEHNYKPKKGER